MLRKQDKFPHAWLNVEHARICTQNMVALNVANARIYMQTSLMVCNRTAPCACGLCSAVPDFTHSNPALNPFCVDRTVSACLLNVAHARICKQNCKISLMVFNRTTPYACRLCSALSNRDTSLPSLRGLQPGFDGLQLLARVAFYLSQLSTSYANLS